MIEHKIKKRNKNDSRSACCLATRPAVRQRAQPSLPPALSQLIILPSLLLFSHELYRFCVTNLQVGIKIFSQHSFYWVNNTINYWWRYFNNNIINMVKKNLMRPIKWYQWGSPTIIRSSHFIHRLWFFLVLLDSFCQNLSNYTGGVIIETSIYLRLL